MGFIQAMKLGWGPSIYDVRSVRGRGGHPKEDDLGEGGVPRSAKRLVRDWENFQPALPYGSMLVCTLRDPKSRFST